ncbi:hypothetical protein PFISCL1PPCAC_15093 [Pristionchus fissidentatus]|uniref:Pre-mRNA-splicing factor 18 n=1 Tax=Pristionchus fissidentatus TaxID=1538716 RepID=A0AAV5VZ74_9BILA|nr:hypothetical protein PFISCL1PPCAC_15093 [Pristionchus fissidentatus]
MDALAKLKEELARKRKQAEELVQNVGGKKMIRRADILAKEEKEYMEKQALKKKKQKEEDDAAQASSSTESKLDVADDDTLTREEVIRRLRVRAQPITLFGEAEADSRMRLIKLEYDQPELNEGWNNDLASAMRDVDNDLVKDVIEGGANDKRKFDVQANKAILEEWDLIEKASILLGASDELQDVYRDCDTMNKFLKYLLARWAQQLNDRDEEEKKSVQGKYQASIYKQTCTNIKVLQNSLDAHTINNDIRHHLMKIIRLLIIDRDYIQANNAYMEMAIGNAPWPVGVTRSGLHQRPGSAKAYVSNIAHVLNDETQRKYIQAFKRLMTRCQEYFPTDPSKCVDFVRA